MCEIGNGNRDAGYLVGIEIKRFQLNQLTEFRRK